MLKPTDPKPFDVTVARTFMGALLTLAVALAAAALLMGCGGGFEDEEPPAQQACNAHQPVQPGVDTKAIVLCGPRPL